MGARPAPAVEPRRLRAAGRRSVPWPVLAGLPLLTVCGLVAAWRDLIPGVAYWDNAVGALVASVRFTGPVAAGLAALVAARHPRERMWPGLGRGAGIAAISYAVLTVAVCAKTLWYGASGHLVVSGVLAGLAALLVHVAVGYVAGALVRSPMTAAVVAVACYLAAGWVLARDGAWWRLLAPTAAPPETVYTAWRPSVFHGQLAWYAGLAALVAAGYAVAVLRRRALVVPLVLAVAVAATGVVQLHRYRGHALTVSAATDLACRDWPLTICVHPALRGALPKLELAAIPVAERLTGTPGAFRRLVQLRAGADARDAGRGTAWMTLRTLSDGYGDAAMMSVVRRLPAARACARPGADRAYTDLVLGWLGTGRVDPHAPQGRAFDRMGESQRRAWLRAHYDRFRTCRLRAEDFAWRETVPRSAYAPHTGPPG